MSKLRLTKEIKQLERHQLEQMILDAYAARKGIKEYFDFFLNPDVDKLIEKYKVAASKEFNRSKRGHSKARISVIKKLLKNLKVSSQATTRKSNSCTTSSVSPS